MLTLEAIPLPLRMDADGTVRVGGTRVTLDTVVTAFEQGNTAEDIARQYPSLRLADIYAVISYYLHHREAVAAYLGQRRQEAEALRREIQSQRDSRGIRERLLARRLSKQE